MAVIRQTEHFLKWIRSLRDLRARAIIANRIDRLAAGNAGDVSPVGEGVSELRIFHGPGYRVYFKRRDETLVIILCGGDKSTQTKDIQRAKIIGRELEE